MLKKHSAPQPKIDYRRTLLAVVRGSVGSRAFRHLYLRRSKSSVDILRGGELSCAYFVSTVLHGLGFLREVHATVDGTIRDLRASGWKKIRRPRVGAVVAWQPITYADRATHGHLGFVLDSRQAVSTSYRRRSPIVHHLTYGRRGSKTHRPVITMWWHSQLDK